MSNETPEATDDPPRDPWFITVIAVIIFAGIVLFGCTWAQKVEADDPLSALNPMTQSSALVQAVEEAPLEPAYAGYWALCDADDHCFTSRLLYDRYTNQEEACGASMGTVRMILSRIFSGYGAGFRTHTECRPVSDDPPIWWMTMLPLPEEES